MATWLFSSLDRFKRADCQHISVTQSNNSLLAGPLFWISLNWKIVTCQSVGKESLKEATPYLYSPNCELVCNLAIRLYGTLYCILWKSMLSPELNPSCEVNPHWTLVKYLLHTAAFRLLHLLFASWDIYVFCKVCLSPLLFGWNVYIALVI